MNKSADRREGDKEIVAGEMVVMVVPTAKKSAKAPEFNKTGIAAKGMGGRHEADLRDTTTQQGKRGTKGQWKHFQGQATGQRKTPRGT